MEKHEKVKELEKQATSTPFGSYLMEKFNFDKKTWRVRRRIVIGTLSFFAFLISFIVFMGDPSPQLTNIAVTLITSGVVLIIGYVTSAVYNDKHCNVKNGNGNHQK